MLGKWYISCPYLRFPIFFSMFAWWPTIPIYKVLSAWDLSKVFCCFSLSTFGRDCSDWDTRRFHLVFLTSLTILRGLSYFLSVCSSCSSFLELFDGDASSFSAPFRMILGLYCCLWESMIAFISSMSFVFIFSAESSFSTAQFVGLGEILIFDETEGKSS